MCALTLSLGVSSQSEGNCTDFSPSTNSSDAISFLEGWERMSGQMLILHLRELKKKKKWRKKNHESKTKRRNHVNKLINCLEVKCMFVILPLSKGNWSSLCSLADLKAFSCTASPRERKEREAHLELRHWLQLQLKEKFITGNLQREGCHFPFWYEEGYCSFFCWFAPLF